MQSSGVQRRSGFKSNAAAQEPCRLDLQQFQLPCMKNGSMFPEEHGWIRQGNVTTGLSRVTGTQQALTCRVLFGIWSLKLHRPLQHTPAQSPQSWPFRGDLQALHFLPHLQITLSCEGTAMSFATSLFTLGPLPAGAPHSPISEDFYLSSYCLH